jgi:pathogenesis-related protein 1
MIGLPAASPPVSPPTTSPGGWGHHLAVPGQTRSARALALLAAVGALLVLAPGGVGCSGAPGQPDPRLADPAERSAFVTALLDAHNNVRANAVPTPSPALPPLDWSDALATTAQGWADRCAFEHSTGNLGENLAVFSQLDVEPGRVVELWASEVSDWNHADNRCAAGRACGHYTQIVWRDTARVGCGVARCDDVADFGAGALWVCNYDPPGNFVGRRPY